MSFAVIIPAQETNKYHRLGDLAPFGDTTLLEWKISQCKEFMESSKIYISSDSKVIEGIARKEDVNFIKRKKQIPYGEIIINTLSGVSENIIIWTNPTAPFLGLKDYLSMMQKYENNNINSIVSVHTKFDYIYYNNQRLNFSDKFTSRNILKPVKIVTNGCYIVEKELALGGASLYSDNPFLFELDYLSAVEIKDLHTYEISLELISAYFKRDLGV
jgi:CMP-N-acetylneuraminic acid synthetase